MPTMDASSSGSFGIGAKDEKEEITKAKSAGFSQRESKVRRTGDQQDYHFDGSVKPSSMVYKRATPNLNWDAPFKGERATWPKEDIEYYYRKHGEEGKRSKDGPSSMIATVRYRGYIPCKDVETVFGTLKTGVQEECYHHRTVGDGAKSSAFPDSIDFLEKEVPPIPQGKRGMEDCINNSDVQYGCYLGKNKEFYRREVWPKYPRQLCFKDHRIPPPTKNSYATIAQIRKCQSQPIITPNVNNPMRSTRLNPIVGHTGWRPMHDQNVVHLTT